MSRNKGYNSQLASNIRNVITVAVVFISIGYGIRGLIDPSSNDIEIERARSGYILQERDLSRDGNNEIFYEIDGKKYFSTIDGKNLEDSLK